MVFTVGLGGFEVWIAHWCDAVKHQDVDEEVERRRRQ